MRYGDLLAKLGSGQQLTPSEAEELRLQGNRQQEMAAQVAGWSGNSGMISSGAIKFPFDIVASHETIVAENNFSFTVPTGYNHLRLVGSLVGTNVSGGPGYAYMTFNDNVSSASYPAVSAIHVGDASAAYTCDKYADAQGIMVGELSGSTVAGPSSVSSMVDTFIPDYNSAVMKNGFSQLAYAYTATGSSYTVAVPTWWWYQVAEPIRKITVTAHEIVTLSTGNQFCQGTKVTLLGHR